VVFSQLTEDNNDVRTEKNTKPSGKKADQNKIINKFEEFLINNIKRDNEVEETFDDFDELHEKINSESLLIILIIQR
ncbi:11636_t:CDS:1, partial [Funneliformis geosporum]